MLGGDFVEALEGTPDIVLLEARPPHEYAAVVDTRKLIVALDFVGHACVVADNAAATTKRSMEMSIGI